MPFLKDRNKISRSQELGSCSIKDGLRHTFFNAGDKYTGEWKNNKKEGIGIMITKAKTIEESPIPCRQYYEGEFVNGYRHGFGVLAYELPCHVFSLQYSGEWYKGKMHGIGLRIFKDKSVYIGNWLNGKREGNGKMWYVDGKYSDGEWVKDMKHGPGMIVYGDGNRYEGNFYYDKKHGLGRYFHLDSGQMQEGIWFEDACLYCVFVDIPFRKTAIKPTQLPINPLKIVKCGATKTEELRNLARRMLEANIKTKFVVSELAMFVAPPAVTTIIKSVLPNKGKIIC